MSKGAFKYAEDAISRAMGVSRQLVRLWRSNLLEEGSDFEKNEGRVLLSEAGVRRVAEFGLMPVEQIDLKACEAKKNGVLTVRVVRICDNPKMVQAEKDTGARILVDVGRNATFALGDELDVGRHETEKGVWQHMGEIPREKRRRL